MKSMNNSAAWGCWLWAKTATLPELTGTSSGASHATGAPLAAASLMLLSTAVKVSGTSPETINSLRPRAGMP